MVQRGVTADDHQVDQRRKGHPGGGGDEGQATFGGTGQTSFIPFAFYLQPDEQEEQRHQTVGHERMEADAGQ